MRLWFAGDFYLYIICVLVDWLIDSVSSARQFAMRLITERDYVNELFLQTYETMSAGFYYEKPMNKAQLAYRDQNLSHIPNGDPEKAPRPISESRERFGDHHVGKPPLARGDWSKPLRWCCHYRPTIVTVVINIGNFSQCSLVTLTTLT